MGLSISGYVLEPPRVGRSNSPFTAGPNNFVPQTLLTGIFSPTSGSNVVPTSASQVGVLTNGNTIVFLNQLGVTYTISTVSPSQIVLTGVYSAALLNPPGPAPTSAYCPQIGTNVQAYSTAYPSSELNPRDDYLVLVTSELAPGIGTNFSVVTVISNGGAVQITTGVATGLANGQTVIVSGVNGVPGANGTFTVTIIDSLNFILNGSVFTGTYGGGGSVLVIQGVPGLLVNAGFGWTKNEVIQRFDYNTHKGSFVPLPGGALVIAGVLSPSANTTRLKVPPPTEVLPDATFRLSIATGGSGTTFAVTLVLNDGAFGSPPVGTAELSQATGNLNWNATDLSTYNGLNVHFQQQQYFALGTSTGNIGTLQLPVATAPAIVLNPLPAHGQFPLIRIGFLYWLTTIEVPNEAAFTPYPGPAAGTVEWAVNTGRLNFNATTDVFNNNGVGVYYDGTLFARDLLLPRQNIGSITSPANIDLPVPALGDIIFTVPSGPNTPYYQFPSYSVVSAFDTSGGTQGTVEILQSSGAVQFSTADQNTFALANVEVVFGDLLIDHGIAIRFFRSPVDLDAQTSGVKDVTAVYNVQDAVLASPIPASPLIFLPSTPVDDSTLQISVGQGTGTFVGALHPVSGPSPAAGLGYIINFDANQLNFAQRFVGVEIPLVVPAGHVQLPNPLVLASNIELALETGTNTSVFLPLTPGIDCVVDATAGLIYFTTTFGVDIVNGSSGTFSGTTLTDPTANFLALNVQVGDYLLIISDSGSHAPSKGVYTITTIPSATTLTVDVTPPAGSGTLSYQILRGKEIMADRFFQVVTLSDPTTSIERITPLGAIQNASSIVSTGAATFPDLSTLSDPSTDFITAGVQPGDTITLTTGPGIGSTFLVLDVSQHTLTPFTSFVYPNACSYTVTRRLQVPVVYIPVIRFRYGVPTPTSPYGVFSVSVVVQPNDASFTPPGSLAQGTVEVSQTTGNLNFSQVDVTAGGPVFVARTLALGSDYQINAGLGFIQFSSRLLTNEEVLMTYTQVPPNTTPPTPPGPPFTERGTFLVRKELTAAHPTPTNTLTFNPQNKSVATIPAPKVFRGGRPQTSLQVTVNGAVNPSTITFLPDPAFPPVVTNALPHGATVNPNENVYIDYYIYQAMGGESSLTVLNPAILTATVAISDGANFVQITGDQTANFPAGFLMVVNANEVYQIGTSTYDLGTKQTTITLAGTQTFQSDQTNPPILVASGPTPLTATVFVPSYFTLELAPYLTIARGMNRFVIPGGDRTGAYQANVVLYATDGTGSFTDFYLVSGSKYDATLDQTTVTLVSNTLRQYTFSSQFIYRSVRPVFAQAPTVVSTSRTPVTIPTPQPMTVIRRVTGQVGQILSTPVDYSADSSGTISYAQALRPEEEFSVFYTGHRIISAGPRLQTSYTATIVPDLATNGLLGQVLNANYTIFNPDSFYWRVETMTRFKGQVAQEIAVAATSATPSSGPMTSNTSSPALYQQGQPSVWFPPGDYANHDIIAQACLKFFNDAINDLEDVLHAIDGRIVGDVDGRFFFDGVLGRYDYYTYDPTIIGFPTYPKPSNIYNQIDDNIQVHPGPLPSYPDSLGYFQQAYVTGPHSRFYKTIRNIWVTTPCVVSSSPNAGDVMATYNFNPLTSLPATTKKRAPRAQILFDTPYGSNTFYVDNINGSSDGTLRPPWTPAPPLPASIIGMLVLIQDKHGNFYVDESDNATVVALVPATPTTPAQITITGIAHTPAGTGGTPPSPPGPYLDHVPAGATIYLSPIDVCVAQQQADGVSSGAAGTFGQSYRFGRDINADLNTGNLLYQNAYWPFDGNALFKLPTLFIPESAYIIPVANGDILEADGVGVSVTYTAPYKIPALYGKQLDDDGNQSIPIVGPTFDGEVTSGGGGALNTEATAEKAGSTFRTTTTTPPFMGTGDLDATGTIITLTSGSTLFPAPVPKVYDLVRITSGVNGVTPWRRITAVQNAIPPATVTVDVSDAFTGPDTGFNFVVAVSAAAPTGLGTATLAGTTFTDAGTGFPFLSGAVTVLGNTYGVVTVTANSYNTTTLDTIAAVVPPSAGPAPSPPWGGITQGSPFSIGDIVTGPGIDSTSGPVTITQIGPGSAVQLSAATTGGNVTGGVFEVQLTQPPPTAGNITGLGDVPAPTNLDSGVSFAVPSFINPIVTITGLANIQPSYVGKQIVLTGSASNNGTFTITSVISPTSVTVNNPLGAAPDTGTNWNIPASPTISNLASTHGMSLGDTVTDTGGAIPGGSVITQIGPGHTITLNNAATAPFPGDTITVSKVVPSTPWSTTVDSIIPNIYPPTTQPSHPTTGFAVGTVLSGPGIPYAPPLTTTTIESTSPSSDPYAGWSLVMSAPATTSTATGDPLSSLTGQSIITVYVPPNVAIGWTIVMLSGPNAGYRRQIVGIVDSSTVTLDAAFPFAGGGTYRVDNPLNTYNGTTLQQINDALNTETTTILTNATPAPPPYVPNTNSEQNALQDFFSTMFTTIVSSTNGAVSGVTLTDTTVDFIGAGATPLVNTGYLVYVHLGIGGAQQADQGIYSIATVVDSHHLMVTPAFPLSGSGIQYEVVSKFGVGVKTLQNIFSIFAANTTFLNAISAFQALIASPAVPPYTGTGNVPVLIGGTPDTNAYANGLNDVVDDLGNRYTDVSNRLTYLDPNTANGPVSLINGALAVGDNLYAKRYAWLNARINLVSGYLILANTALAQVYANQQNIYNQLIQLLTVEGS